MKVYQAYVEYYNLTYPNDSLITYKGDTYHKTPEAAQKDIDYYSDPCLSSTFKVVHSEVRELDVPESIFLEGILKESDDRQLYMEEDDFRFVFTIDDIIRNHFLGHKIKITVELVKE